MTVESSDLNGLEYGKNGKFENLCNLPPDHVFQGRDFSGGTKRNDNIKFQWAEVWISIRSDRPDYTRYAGAGKNYNIGILEAFNQLSTKQLRVWIDSLKVDEPPSTTTNNNMQPQTVRALGKKFENLSNLSADHVFKSSDFSDISKKNNNVKVQWAEVWIQRRSDRPAFDTIGILEAFNHLSNKQLREWIDSLKVDVPQSATTTATSNPSPQKHTESTTENANQKK